MTRTVRFSVSHANDALKTSLAICAAVLAQTAGAAGEVELYGRLDLSLQHADEANAGQMEVRNNASRVGVRGGLPVQAGLSVLYQLEFGVDLDDEAEGTFTDRNQFVGLQGSFGTIKVGRHDTALKQAQGDFDLFDDQEGDIGAVFNGEVRLKDYIGYVTPAFGGGFTATLNFFPGEDAQGGDEGSADAASASLAYERDAAYVAVAHDRDVEGEDSDTTRVVGGYTLGPARLMLLYQRADVGSAREDGFGASVAWELGASTVKLQYLAADIWRLDPQADPRDNRLRNLVSVGLDHKLGEDTKVFAFYTVGEPGGTSGKHQYAGIGMQHNF